MRVLIVEENPSVARQLATVLTNLRHEVVGMVRDGAGAVRVADESRPDVVFFSLVSTQMDALAALRVLRRVVPGASLVVLGGTLERSRVREALKAGAQGYVRKPFLPADIRDALRRYTHPAR